MHPVNPVPLKPVTNRIIPALAALVISISAIPAFSATIAEVQTALGAKLRVQPGLARPAAVTDSNATFFAPPQNLILAVREVLNDATAPNNTFTAAEVAEAALAAITFNNRTFARADRDLIADDIIQAAIESEDVADNPTEIALTVRRVYRVNSSLSATLQLTPVGRALAVAQGLRFGTAAGSAIAAEIADFPANTIELGALITTTSIQLGTSATAAAPALESFVAGIFNNANALNASDAAARRTFAFNTAQSVTANRSAVAAIIGGYFSSTLPTAGNTEITTLATDVLARPLLAGSIAEVLATTAQPHTNKVSLATTLSTFTFRGQQLPRAIGQRAQIAQGLINAGISTDVGGIVSTLLGTTPTLRDVFTFTPVAAATNGADSAKIAALTTALRSRANISDTLLATFLINGTAPTAPEAASTIAGTLITNLANDTARNNFATAVARSTSALGPSVGYLAKTIADANTTGQEAQTAAAIIRAAPLATVNIAQRVSELNVVQPQTVIDGSLTRNGSTPATTLGQRSDDALSVNDDFAATVASLVPAQATNIAVGTSITDPNHSEFIASRVIGTNATTIELAHLTAYNVAKAVDEENAAWIGARLAALATQTGRNAENRLTIRTAQIPQIASFLGLAIQQKPGVTTANRADELSEIASSMVAGLIGKIATGSNPTAALINSEAALINSVFTSVLATLSKADQVRSHTLLADQSFAPDLAGSVMLTVRLASGNQSLINRVRVLLTDSANTRTLIPNASTRTSVLAAITATSAATIAPELLSRYETGPVTDKETDTKNG